MKQVKKLNNQKAHKQISSNDSFIIGVDEVGVSALAGPLYACATYLISALPDSIYQEVKDSKLLSPKKREILARELKKYCCYSFGSVSSKELRYLNLHQARMLAMSRAIDRLYLSGIPDLIIFDGTHVPIKYQGIGVPVIGADNIFLPVAIASILAKVRRDSIMVKLHNLYPHYDWASNKGYPAPNHWQGIERFGLCPLHRTERFTRLREEERHAKEEIS